MKFFEILEQAQSCPELTIETTEKDSTIYVHLLCTWKPSYSHL